MKVFEIVENNVTLNPDILNIPCFKVIYDRDKDKNKVNALKDLSFIYHMSDNNSIYADFPKQEKENRIKVDFKIELDYANDLEIQEAINTYKSFIETPKQRLLQAAKNKIDEFADFMNNTKVDVDSADTILKIFKDISTTIANFDKLEEAVKKEKESNNSKVRGNKSISMFEQ
jgi:hypothetical protein